MACWVGVGTQQPQVGLEPMTSRSQIRHRTTRTPRTQMKPRYRIRSMHVLNYHMLDTSPTVVLIALDSVNTTANPQRHQRQWWYHLPQMLSRPPEVRASPQDCDGKTLSVPMTTQRSPRLLLITCELYPTTDIKTSVCQYSSNCTTYRNM